MSSRVFQSITEQLTEASQTSLGVVDAEGIVVAAGEKNLIGERWPDVVPAIEASPEVPIRFDGKLFFALTGWNATFGFAAFVMGTDEAAMSVCRMADSVRMC